MCFFLKVHSLKLTYPLKIGYPKRIHFQGQTVSFRKCSLGCFFPYMVFQPTLSCFLNAQPFSLGIECVFWKDWGDDKKGWHSFVLWCKWCDNIIAGFRGSTWKVGFLQGGVGRNLKFQALAGWWRICWIYTVVKVDGATPKRWRFVRGYDTSIHGSCAIYFPGGIYFTHEWSWQDFILTCICIYKLHVHFLSAILTSKKKQSTTLWSRCFFSMFFHMFFMGI